VGTVTLVLRWAGVVLVLGGLGVSVGVGAADDEGWPRRQFARYAAHLSRGLRAVRAGMTGQALARLELAVVVGALVGAVLLEEIWLALAAPLVVALPLVGLEDAWRKRVARCEEQLAGWLVMLGNAIHATPSLGEGIASSAELVGGPLGEELDIVVKETRLGTSLDEALLAFARRLDSHMVSGAVAALVIARQTGGELGPVLDETAASLREMQRLEGVLRAKTAEARAQAYVMLAIPFVVVGAIYGVDPGWLEPLGNTTLGYAVVAGATALWVGAVLVARVVLAVDL
jgi:tight adherence protein B